mmetsp:Transcript_20489/g.30052  ORF Transcript_20489/g.30052 Transcript_20489/m.30052 type:complete len:99 (+) Transcript_20489:1167-1463(+)
MEEQDVGLMTKAPPELDIYKISAVQVASRKESIKPELYIALKTDELGFRREAPPEVPKFISVVNEEGQRRANDIEAVSAHGKEFDVREVLNRQVICIV